MPFHSCWVAVLERRSLGVWLLLFLELVSIYGIEASKDWNYTATVDKPTPFQRESVTFRCPADTQDRLEFNHEEGSTWGKSHKLLSCGWLQAVEEPEPHVKEIVTVFHVTDGHSMPTKRYQKGETMCDFKINRVRSQDSGQWSCFMEVERLTSEGGTENDTYFSITPASLTVKLERFNCLAAAPQVTRQDEAPCICPEGYLLITERQQCVKTCQRHLDCPSLSLCVPGLSASNKDDKLCSPICEAMPCGANTKCKVLPYMRDRDCACDPGTIHVNETHCDSDRAPVALNLMENGNHLLRIAPDISSQAHSIASSSEQDPSKVTTAPLLRNKASNPSVIYYMNQGQKARLGCLAEDASPVTREPLWSYSASDFPHGYTTLTFSNVSMHQTTKHLPDGLTVINLHEEIEIDTTSIKSRRTDRFSCGFKKFARTLDVDVVVSVCHSQENCGLVTKSDIHVYNAEQTSTQTRQAQASGQLTMVKPGSSMKLSCQTDLHLAVRQKGHCMWVHEQDGQVLTQREGKVMEQDEHGSPSINNCELDLKDVQLALAGHWYCQVTLDLGRVGEASRKVVGQKMPLAVLVGPEPATPSLTLEVEKGRLIQVEPSQQDELVFVPTVESNGPTPIKVNCIVRNSSVAPMIKIFKDGQLLSESLAEHQNSPSLPTFGKLQDFSSSVEINLRNSCLIACSYSIGTVYQQDELRQIRLQLDPQSPSISVSSQNKKHYYDALVALLSISAGLILFASIVNAILKVKEHKLLKIRRRSLRASRDFGNSGGNRATAVAMAASQVTAEEMKLSTVISSGSVKQQEPKSPTPDSGIMEFPTIMDMAPSRHSRHRLLSQLSKSEEILPGHLSFEDDEVFEAPSAVSMVSKHGSLPKGLNNNDGNKKGNGRQKKSSSLMHLPARLTILNPADGCKQGSFRLLSEDSVDSP